MSPEQIDDIATFATTRLVEANARMILALDSAIGRLQAERDYFAGNVRAMVVESNVGLKKPRWSFQFGPVTLTLRIARRSYCTCCHEEPYRCKNAVEGQAITIAAEEIGREIVVEEMRPGLRAVQ